MFNMIPLDILTIYSQSITLNLRNILLIYIHLSIFSLLHKLYNYQSAHWIIKKCIIVITNAALCEVLSIWWRPILNYAVYRYRNFNGNHMIRLQFETRQSIHFSGKCCSFRNDICIFQILNPNQQIKQIFSRSFGAQGFRFECQKGFGNNYIYTGFLSAFSFWKFQPQLYWIFDCDFCDPCALLPTGYRKRTKTIRFSACSDIKKWLLNWQQFTLLIFIKLNVNYGNMNWVDTFFAK